MNRTNHIIAVAEWSQTRALLILAFVMAATLGIVYGLTALVVQVGIVGRNPNLNTDKRHRSFDNPYEDIVKVTIPRVQQWYRSLNVDDQTNPLIPYHDNPYPAQVGVVDSKCLETWFSEIQGLVSETNPALIKWILFDMGFSQTHSVLKHLQLYLDEPQPLSSLYLTSQICLQEMQGLPALACAVRQKMPWELSDPATQDFIRYAVHVGLVLEVLTQALRTDFVALHRAISIMRTTQRDKFESVIQLYPVEKRFFFTAKYEGVAQGLEQVGEMLVKNEQSTPLKPLFQTNILEATLLDISAGLESNARLGLALSAAVNFDSSVDDHRLVWALGKDWISGYMTWNMAVVLSHLPKFSLSKLLVPSTVCYGDNGEDWILSRAISLSLSLMLTPSSPDPSLDVPSDAAEHIQRILSLERTASIARAPSKSFLGETNLQSIRIDSPSHNDVEEMLYELCDGKCHEGSWWVLSDTTPHARMSDAEFAIYLGMIYWITMVMTGLGLEFLVWISCLSPKHEQGFGWSARWAFSWYAVQFVFSLLVAAALGLAINGNFLSMPLLTIAVWKFGFPETLMYLWLGLFDGTMSLGQRLAEVLNGLGLVVHHAAMALSISMLLAGVISPERSLLSPTFILVMQHWFVIVKYINEWAYMLIELTLEIFFQWILLSQFENFVSNHWTASLIGAAMLVAHWLFLIAGGIELLLQSLHWDNKEASGCECTVLLYDPSTKTCSTRETGSSNQLYDAEAAPLVVDEMKEIPSTREHLEESDSPGPDDTEVESTVRRDEDDEIVPTTAVSSSSFFRGRF